MPFSLQGSCEFHSDKPCSSCYKNIHNMYLYAVCLLLFYHSNMNPINYISVKFVIHSWTFVLSFKHELPGISHELGHKFISGKFVFHSWTFVFLSFRHELPGISHELDHKFISVKFVFHSWTFVFLYLRHELPGIIHELGHKLYCELSCF